MDSKKIPKNQPKRHSESPFVTIPMGMERYNMSRSAVMELSRQANALLKFDRTYRINVEVCDKFFVDQYTV
jgi:hypothetical protein